MPAIERGVVAGASTALLLVFGAAAGPAANDVSIIAPPDEGRKYWSRWRGPSGQGQVSGGQYPDRWSATDNVLWRVPVPGEGNSSPVVWGDRIFLTAAHDGGRRRSILCFRRSDGELLWETSAPEARAEDFHRKNGAASSTPTTDGERVYAYLGNSGLLAVDLEGRRIWHTDLGRFNAYHGTASSPLLYGSRVIVAQDHQGKSGSFIAAFSTRDGSEIWRTTRTERVGWSSPIAIRAGERHEIVLSGQEAVRAYDPATGEELWYAEGNTYEAIPTPVVGHGLVYCSPGRAGPTLAIRPGGNGNVTETHVAWAARKGSPFVPSAVLDDGRFYIVNDMSSVVTGYDAASGEVLWQGRLGEARREGFSASPVAVGGKVFFTSDSGETFVLDSGPEFDLLHVNRLDEPVLASPALVDGIWYFRTRGNLLAIGKTGSPATAR
jgi:outer membrane protein assembly factor BamB